MTLSESDPRGADLPPETLEPTEGVQPTENTAAQQLNDATFEPGARVEQTGNFQQSETIQRTFTAIVDTSAAVAQGTAVPGDAGSPAGNVDNPLPGPLPQVDEAASAGTIPSPGEAESLTPIQMPRVDEAAAGGIKPSPGDPESLTPIQMPRVNEAASAGTIPSPGEAESLTPIQMPRVDEAASGGIKPSPGDPESLTPIQMPRVNEAASAGTISTPGEAESLTPIQMPRVNEAASAGSIPTPGEAESLTPIQMPRVDEAALGGIKPSPGDPESLTPIQMPRVNEAAAAGTISMPGEAESLTPIQMPRVDESASGSIKPSPGDPESLTPIQMPRVDAATSIGSQDIRGDQASIRPGPLPPVEDSGMTGIAGSHTDQLSDLPGPMPRLDGSITAGLTGATSERVNDLPGSRPRDGQAALNSVTRLTLEQAQSSPVSLEGIMEAASGVGRTSDGNSVREVSPNLPRVHTAAEETTGDRVIQGVQKGTDAPLGGSQASDASQGKTTGEGEGSINPPDIYVNILPSGGFIFVDASGKPLGSTLKYTTEVDQQGQMHVYIMVQDASGNMVPYDVPGYSQSLSGDSIYILPGGQPVVVDANGMPIADQPVIKVVSNEKGEPVYTVYYPGGGSGVQPIELPPYSTSLSGDSVYVDEGGHPHVVDASGMPIPCQPKIEETTNQKGETVYTVSYPGSGPTSQPVELPAYSPSLSGDSIGIDMDGRPFVVDGSGKPIESQPVITAHTNQQGEVVYTVYYPGSSSNSQPVELPPFSTSLSDDYVHPGPEKPIIVDAKGFPLTCQPQIHVTTGKDGEAIYTAWYPGGEPVQMAIFQPPPKP